MRQSASSRQWLREHHTDPFVLKARGEGYRSRAVYKLKELQEKHRFICPGARVLDLGAAPGSWSQYVVEVLNGGGTVMALDRLIISDLPGVEAIQGDFQDPATLKMLEEKVGEKSVDVLLSDMAPNTSGVKAADGLRSIQLAEEVMVFADDVLAPGGALLMKVFQGPGFDALLRDLKMRFTKVCCKKPQASRLSSPEIYMLATKYKML